MLLITNMFNYPSLASRKYQFGHDWRMYWRLLWQVSHMEQEPFARVLVKFVLLDLLFSLECFVDHCCILLSFDWPLYRLSCDLRLLITPLISSNISYYWKRSMFNIRALCYIYMDKTIANIYSSLCQCSFRNDNKHGLILNWNHIIRKNYYLKSDIIDYSVWILKYFRRQSTIQSHI